MARVWTVLEGQFSILIPLWAALDSICARFSLRFETRLPDAKSSKPSRSSSVRLMMYRVAIPNMGHTSGGMESEKAITSMETEH
jgi:hypothetical protein